MLLRLAILVLLLLPLPAAAQDGPGDMAGNWTFGIGPVGVFQFRVERDGEDWHGIWLRPKSFASNGVVFLNLQGPPIDVPASQVREVNGWLELTFDDPRPGAVPDIFLLRTLADGTAEAIYADTGFPPFNLVRDDVEHGIGPWDSTVAYLRAGLDVAAAGPPIQFSSGTSALASRLAELVEAREALNAGPPSDADPQPELVQQAEPAEPPEPSPAEERDQPPPVMEGR